jgi:hypothetical protein
MFVALSQAVFDRMVKDNAKVYNMSKNAKRIYTPGEKGVAILHEWSRNTDGNIFVCYTVFVCKNPRRRSKKNQVVEKNGTNKFNNILDNMSKNAVLGCVLLYVLKNTNADCSKKD